MPATPSAPSAALLPAPRRAVPSTPTILVVEDDRQLRVLLQRILERRGYRVILVGRGDEALLIEDAELETVDLLLADVFMPGADGPTVARGLEARRPGLPTLLVSGYAEGTALDPAVESGTSFLAKPYTPDVLVARIRELLDPVGHAA